MLAKLKLDQKEKYARLIAVKEISQMLVAFIQGRDHSLSIGSEQGGIKKWDDFVVEEANGTYKHIQVKRQQTPFSNYSCIRDRDKKGNLKELSSFDEAILSLAEWVKQNDPKSIFPKRRFVLVLPDSTPLIKKDLQIRHLHSLIHNQIKAETTVHGLINLKNAEESVKNIFKWLTTWCDFTDWEHILKAFKLLSIELARNEIDIENDIINILSPVFHSVNKVLREIILYIDDNTTFTGVFTPRPLLNLLKEYLRPEIATWTQYQKNNSGFNISGIHDLEFNEVERPSVVVPLLWSNESTRHLKLDIPVDDSTIFTRSIIQLAIHLKGQANAHISNLNGWKQTIKSLTGGTLGVSCEDCDDLSIQSSPSFTVSDSRALDSRKKFEVEADYLQKEMIRVTFEKVCKQIKQKLNNMKEKSELCDAMENCWKNWKSGLEKDHEKLTDLLKNMLHPNAESADHPELRIGPKTVSLIANGIFLLLLVSVGLGGSKEDWKKVGNDLSVNTIGLDYWSGPAGSPRKVREICDDAIINLIGKESSDVLILSKVKISPTDIFKESLASDCLCDDTLVSMHRPKLLVTNNLTLQKLVSEGNIEKLESYLKNIIEKRTESLKQSIKEVL